jgi:hypothetical protein
VTIGLIKYVQSHGLAHPVDGLLQSSRGGPPGYDVVAELVFESAAALHRDLLDRATPAAGLALLEDEKQFIDLARSPLFTRTERSTIELG